MDTACCDSDLVDSYICEQSNDETITVESYSLRQIFLVLIVAILFFIAGIAFSEHLSEISLLRANVLLYDDGLAGLLLLA